MSDTLETLLSTEEAVRELRRNPASSALVRDTYLDEDVRESATRFLTSAEFASVLELVGPALPGAEVLDLGAGRGIASFALASSGAGVVYALEPDPSSEVGRGAISELPNSLPIEALDGTGEHIPLADESIDIVYVRQTLRHTADLPKTLLECARVLRSGGVFLACREHVVDDERQLQQFLEAHPLHRMTGGENAFPLKTYVAAILNARLVLDCVLGPWDSVINAFPEVRSQQELERMPCRILGRRFGHLGRALSFVPGVDTLVWLRIRRPLPGQLHTFLARKP